MTRPRPAKLLRQLLFAGLGLCALWVVGVNALLASPLPLRLLNGQPDSVQFQYTRARSYVPFVIHLEGFQLRVQDPAVQLHVTAERVSAFISPWTLARRHFRATGVRGEGLTVRLRRRPQALAKTAPDLSKVFTVELLGLHLDHLREVWIDEYHFEGDVEVRGGFQLEPLQSLRLDRARLHVLRGAIRLRGGPLARLSEGTAEADLRQTDLRSFSLQSLKGLSAKVRLDAEVFDVRLLNQHLRDVPAVQFLAGHGQLAVDASLERGRLGEGSTLTLETPRLVMRLPFFDVGGRGAVRWKAAEGKTRLAVELERIVLTMRRGGEAQLEGSRFRLQAESASLDVSEELPLEVALRLDGATARDFSFLNAFIPPRAGVRVLSGTGEARGELFLSTKTNRARGTLKIDGEELVLQNRGATLTGRAEIRVKLVELDLKTGDMTLSGSSLALDRVTVNTQGTTTTGFWLKLATDPCVVRPRGEPAWKATLALESHSLRPILDMVGVNVPIPWVLKAVSNQGEVKAGTTLWVREDSVELADLRLEAGRIALEGAVRLAETAQPSGGAILMPFGAVLAKVSGMEVAVAFEGQRSTPVLIGAKGWYRAQQAKSKGGADVR
ncbi:MAG: hypothetical protein ACYC8T_07265 [Myxococcaceae bacterium]